jgi:fucose 4-O-acetylase-like acetyltransferase
MPVTVQIYLWGFAAVLPLLLNIGTRRNADAIGLAGMLLITWCIGRVVSMFYTVPQSMGYYPFEDAICGAIAFAAWRTQREWWKLLLTGLFVLQLALALSFWGAWSQGHKEALNFYRPANNASFALELLCAGWGALAYVGGHLLSRVPGLARVGHHRRAGP